MRKIKTTLIALVLIGSAASAQTNSGSNSDLEQQKQLMIKNMRHKGPLHPSISRCMDKARDAKDLQECRKKMGPKNYAPIPGQ